jgi:hypothetical protein
MRKSELAQAADPDYLREQVPRNRPMHMGHHHGSTTENVREVEYNGHTIRIRTTYAIEVDGTPITGHVGVTNEGRVHYHALPTLNFPSAIDMVKELVDKFPDDFRSDHDGHSHGSGAGDGGDTGQHSH